MVPVFTISTSDTLYDVPQAAAGNVRGATARERSCYNLSMSATVAACENHLQREAIGVCVQCRVRVCSECSTKVEGINHCVTCLAGLAREGGRKVGARAQPSRLGLRRRLGRTWCC